MVVATLTVRAVDRRGGRRDALLPADAPGRRGRACLINLQLVPSAEGAFWRWSGESWGGGFELPMI